ncbi:hypothetical protein GQ54DRAFT_112781 [Martensiomyces pterosporus]|nr:hypothetical protein GQ54DRAFT_112781 [Martensiomyces pterosporus]
MRFLFSTWYPCPCSLPHLDIPPLLLFSCLYIYTVSSATHIVSVPAHLHTPVPRKLHISFSRFVACSASASQLNHSRIFTSTDESRQLAGLCLLTCLYFSVRIVYLRFCFATTHAQTYSAERTPIRPTEVIGNLSQHPISYCGFRHARFPLQPYPAAPIASNKQEMIPDIGPLLASILTRSAQSQAAECASPKPKQLAVPPVALLL